MVVTSQITAISAIIIGIGDVHLDIVEVDIYIGGVSYAIIMRSLANKIYQINRQTGRQTDRQTDRQT